MRNELLHLLDVAEAAEAGSVLALMGGKSNPHVAQDIPVAAEMLGLLRHFMDRLPYQATEDASLALAPGIYVRSTSRQVIALVPIQAGELDLVAYWLCQGFQSPKLASMPGLLAIPFSIEEHDDQRWLIPEWFALFYVDASVEHCVPLLALRSVLDDSRFSDWVPAALARAASFGLSTDKAVLAAERVVVQKSGAA
ncbi:hypothetical protein [Bordetella flabilis]|uniref:Uncharacterized protein n=1 Tax=Bordetella flabilis TaxID=463014 RepID=A0A193GMR2_9BORD|nr:hypothetical protein [Bordetella flabilis]ANN80903.1 hypothetical protein BAU07_26300 [Bordetella flabilis]